MKQTRLWLATIAVLLCSLTASAHDFEVDGIYYNITSSSDLTVEVTYKGDIWDSYFDEYSGAVTIPSTVTYNGKTYEVTSIGESAFDTCSGLTSITIPASVKSIGDFAFGGCDNLKFLVCLALTPPTLGEAVFASEDLGEIEPMLYVLIESLTDYRNAYGWRYLPCTNTTILYISTSRGSWAIEQGGDALKSSSDLGIRATADDSRQQFAIISDVGNDGGISYYLYHPSEKKFVNKDGGLGYCAAHPVYFKKGAYANTYVVYFDESHYINIGGSNQMVISSWSTVDAGNSCTIAVVEEEYDLTEALEKLPVVVDGCSYGRISTDEVKLVSISRTLNELEIPTTVVIKGKNYSVTNIGDYAFQNCGNLSSITIPESVTSIGEAVFQNCGNLSSITIPESVTSIGEAVFQHCSNLTSITLPEGVTSIGRWAFEGCSSLTSITIPESVTSIGGWAFRDCSSLTSVIIPSSVTSIGDGVFQRCSNLASLVVKEGNTTYDSRDNCNAIIETSSNMLIYGCNSTIIPNSVTSIRSYAFSGCSSLTSITIPSSVTSIGTHAFGDCSGLTSITIPENSQLTSIESSAFSGTAWYNNHPDGVVYAGKVLYKYKGTMPENTSIEVEEGTMGIAGGAFENCSSLTSITLPKSVTSIGAFAFYGCSSLTAVHISSIEAWCKIAFKDNPLSYAHSLYLNGELVTNLVIPEGVTSIGRSAFEGCSSLTSITILENSQLTSIGDYAFSGCSSLTAITIPEGVTSIGSNAFYYCTSLQWVLNFSNLVFQKGSSENGRIAYYAKEVINGIRVGDYVFQITDGTNYLVYYFGVDTILSLPENYNGDDYEIAADAFRGKSTITSIVIPESVTSVGSNAFSGCSGLKSLFVGTNVDTYGENVFEGCTAVEELTVMGSVMPMVPSDKFTTIRMFSPGPLDTEEFDAKVYRTATLYVPEGSLARYQMADVWKKFWYIEEFDPNEEIEVTLDRTTVTMTEGDVITLVATIIPQYIKDKTVAWTTSDAAIATVDNGVVTAVSEGTATITAKAGDKEATCVVTVEKKVIAVSGITLDQTEATLTEGETLALTATVTPDNATDKTVTWSSSNTSVATVDEHGVVTAVAEGTATITAKAGEKEATCTVTVAKKEDENAGVGQLTMDKGQLTIYDLTGRKVENPAKGIYIVGGKKTVIK